VIADGISLWLPAVVSAAGAVSAFAVWSRPAALKIWALAVSLASFVLLLVFPGEAVGLSVEMLLPVAAFFSLLGQPAHEDNRVAWILTLLLLGLGLGVLAAHDGLGLILSALLLIVLVVVLYRYRALSVSHLWQGIGVYGFGVVCLVAALVAPQPVSAVAVLAVCAMLLPLVPLHAGYVAALAGLPGNLPAFLACLLPALGFHGFIAVFPHLPGDLQDVLPMVGLVGAVYGALKALAQSRVRALLAYANLSFFSMLWWYLATMRTVPSQAALYLASVGLATNGLLLAWYALRARYGDMDLRAIRGLAHPMPRFAVLFALLILAALGLPPFGVFAGFMGLLLTPGLPLSGALAVVMLVWLSASWYLLDLLQRLLFGRHRPELRYEDLGRAEFASLLALVLLLCAMGLAPAHVFRPGTPAISAQPVVGDVTWNR
jgi:NADH-quinone oxidoreductase subunit M